MTTTERAHLLQAAGVLRDLVATEGWRLYRKLVEEHIQSRILGAMEDRPEAFLEHRGFYHGLRFSLKIPELMLEQAVRERADER